jgi:hypothetical protein
LCFRSSFHSGAEAPDPGEYKHSFRLLSCLPAACLSGNKKDAGPVNQLRIQFMNQIGLSCINASQIDLTGCPGKAKEKPPVTSDAPSVFHQTVRSPFIKIIYCNDVSEFGAIILPPISLVNREFKLFFVF